MSTFTTSATGEHLITRNGTFLSLVDPRPTQFTWHDVAIGLSRAPRWGGQTPYPFTVAQHSLCVAALCADPTHKLYALLHDASEAFICDVPSPLKRIMGAHEKYAIVERRLMECILQKAGLTHPIPQEVLDADAHMARVEFLAFWPKLFTTVYAEEQRELAEKTLAHFVERGYFQQPKELYMNFYEMQLEELVDLNLKHLR